MKSCCVGGSLRMAATSTLPCTSQNLPPATAGECPLPFFYEGQSSARPDGRGSFLQNIQNGMACRGWVASAEIDYKTVCQEPLFVIPYGLGYFAKDAVAQLNEVLRMTGFPDTLEVPKKNLALNSSCMYWPGRTYTEFPLMHGCSSMLMVP